MEKTPNEQNQKSKKFKIIFILSIPLLITGGIVTWILLTPKQYILNEAKTYDYEGKTITQDIHITVDGVKLKNAVVEGDIYVDESVGEGHVELENITAKGITYVYGGGKDTIMVIGGQICELLGEFNGRIWAINWANLDKVVVKSSDLILKTDENSKYKRVEVQVPEYGDDDKPVELDGNIDELVDNGEADLTLKKGCKIQKYIPSCIGSGCVYSKRKSTVNMEEGSNIKEATVVEPTKFEGEGTVDDMDVQSEEVEVDVEIEEVNSEESYDVVSVDPAFVGDPIRKMTSSIGDYELTFETNSEGVVYYILQPPTNFEIKTPTVAQIKNGEGNSICSGSCPPEDVNVVSYRAIEIVNANTPVTVKGFYGDAVYNARPDENEMDFEFDPSSTLFAVFVNDKGETSDILRVEY